MKKNEAWLTSETYIYLEKSNISWWGLDLNIYFLLFRWILEVLSWSAVYNFLLQVKFISYRNWSWGKFVTFLYVETYIFNLYLYLKNKKPHEHTEIFFVKPLWFNMSGRRRSNTYHFNSWYAWLIKKECLQRSSYISSHNTLNWREKKNPKVENYWTIHSFCLNSKVTLGC